MPTSSALPPRPLARGRAELSTDGDRAVLAIETVIDHAVVDEIVDDLTRLADGVPDGGRLHLDLRLAGVLAPNPLRRLVRTIREDLGARCRFVVDRVSARVLLERWSITDDITVVTELP